MKTVRRFRSDEEIPSGGKYLYSQQERHYSHTENDPGFFWSTKKHWYRTDTFHYYEFEEKENISERL